MATNFLYPFANGDTPNVISASEWGSLPVRLTGFQRGIASSQQFNYVLAQGTAAGYALGQFVVDYTSADATISASELYANFKKALAAFVPAGIADNSLVTAKFADLSVTTAKIATGAVTDAKLASNSVSSAKIQNSAVTTDKIASGAVTFTSVSRNAIATEDQALAGTASNVLMTPQTTAQAISKFAIPTGMMCTYFGKTIPEGFLLCNGGTIRRADYPELAAILAQFPSYAGDGSTTVTLPNLLNRFIEYTTDISKVGEYVDAGLPSMTGDIRGTQNYELFVSNNPAMSGVFRGTTGDVNNSYGGGGVSNTTKDLSFDASRASSVYGRSTTVQPQSLRALPIIKF